VGSAVGAAQSPRAVGPTCVRRESLRIVLDRIIERGAEKPISGNPIIKAVHAQCCLTDDNKWVEPARHVIDSRQELNAKEVSNRQRANSKFA
jgi:hypothetical protein